MFPVMGCDVWMKAYLIVCLWMVCADGGVAVVHATSKKDPSECQPCKCSMSATDAYCAKQIRVGGVQQSCYTVVRGLGLNGKCYLRDDTMGIDRVDPPGVRLTRSDCCEPWAPMSFEGTSSDYLVLPVSQEIYVKNFSTRLWQPKSASPSPPMLDFPGLAAVMSPVAVGIAYDNTTCRHRCCVLGLVDRQEVEGSRQDECAIDWTRCVTTDFDAMHGNGGAVYPSCSDPGAQSAAQCTVWVPCSDSQWWVVEPCVVLCVFVGLFVFACWFRVYRVRRWVVETGEVVYLCIVVLNYVISILALVSACRYMRWSSETEVDVGYISYQACVAYCNAITYPPRISLGRYCAESFNDTFVERLAVWEEDFNPFMESYSDTCDLGEYCSRCASKTGEFSSMEQLALYLRVRVYVSGCIPLFLLFFPERLGWLMGSVKYGASWIALAVLLAPAYTMSAGHTQLDAVYSAMGSKVALPLMRDVCVACVVVDVLLWLMLLCMSVCKKMRKGRVGDSYVEVTTGWCNVSLDDSMLVPSLGHAGAGFVMSYEPIQNARIEPHFLASRVVHASYR